jgi:hypothetical protein
MEANDPAGTYFALCIGSVVMQAFIFCFYNYSLSHRRSVKHDPPSICLLSSGVGHKRFVLFVLRQYLERKEEGVALGWLYDLHVLAIVRLGRHQDEGSKSLDGDDGIL